MNKDTNTQTIQAIERASKIVEHVAEAGELGASELAGIMNLPKSTAHIYLKTLADCQYLINDEGRYRLGLRFLEQGSRARRQLDIYEAAKEEIEKIARSTDEVSNLGVAEAGMRVLLYKVEGREAVYDDAPTGEFCYLHWVSLGKAMLAFFSEERVQNVIERHGLPASTDQTITDETELADELARVREQGYALEDEEHWESIRGVAVPIAHDGTVFGSISVSGPKSRFSRDRIEQELIPELQNSANIIELRIKHYQ